MPLSHLKPSYLYFNPNLCPFFKFYTILFDWNIWRFIRQKSFKIFTLCGSVNALFQEGLLSQLLQSAIIHPTIAKPYVFQKMSQIFLSSMALTLI